VTESDEPTEPSPTPKPTTKPKTVRSKLRVGPAVRKMKAGKKATWTLRLTAAKGGPRRTVKVVFDPAKGKSVRVGNVRLSTTRAAGVQTGRFSYRPKKKGRFVVTYVGRKLSPTLRDTNATGVARVLIR